MNERDDLNKPSVKVNYELRETTRPNLNDVIGGFLHR